MKITEEIKKIEVNVSTRKQIAEFKKIDNSDKYEGFFQNPDLTEDCKLWIIMNYGGCFIKYIKNPSEEIQLKVVKKDGWNIQFIINPIEEAQIEAVKQSKWFIRHIQNPTENVKELARSYGICKDEKGWWKEPLINRE